MSGGRISTWVQATVERRGLVLFVTCVLVAVAMVMASWLKLDALPDVTNNQVLVLTRAPGLAPEETESLVTRPIEAALGGMQWLKELRSISRYGISAVTAVFEDEAPPLVARQITAERLATISLPPGVDVPALGPLTGGLGEVFHFSITSTTRTLPELLELATLRIAPRLRMVPGIVEVNTWGGAERRLEVRADPLRLATSGVSMDSLVERLRQSIGSTAGASIPAGDGQALLRGVFRPQRPEDLSSLLLPSDLGTTATKDAPSRLRLSDVASVTEGESPRLGAATQDGRGEVVYLMAQMLRGENALEVLRSLHARMDEVRATLPADVQVKVIYDRSLLVHATLRTVAKNLLEGGFLVAVVLLLTLGSLRAGLLVAAVIPLSMLGASVAMVVAAVPGNLMSLGAVDFGLLVDGAVVMVEHLFHTPAERDGPELSVVQIVRERAGEVAKPVLFSVLIILLVYVPVLMLGGVEGKMFRPMAITVVCALFTSLILALLVVPAAAAQLLRRRDLYESRPPLLIRGLKRIYQPLLERAVAHPAIVAVLAGLLLASGVLLLLRSGSEFVPQLDEGDLVIQTTRHADISLETAVFRAQGMESLLRQRPEVEGVVSRIGSPAVATDIMGLEQADVFVRLKPIASWRPGLQRDALIREIEEQLAKDDPGSEPSFTQPIQMRFNEILAGAVTDVVVSIYGEDLALLDRLARAVARSCAAEPGAEDVRVMAPPAVPLAEVRPRAIEAAQAGLSPGEILSAVQAVRSGIPLGNTFFGPVRLPVVLRLGEAAPEAASLHALPLPLAGGGIVPLGRVADVSFLRAPTLILRHNGERRLMVGFNVRGVDLGTLLQRAERRVRDQVPMPAGYRLVWGGQYETFAAARARLGILIPVVLLIILGVLWRLFGSLRPTLILFSAVPFAGTGGVLALSARGMPISISAAIGFIALSGIAVLNGVVLMVRLLDLEQKGLSPQHAALQAASTRMRPVLVTALVAALGFVPMAMAQGVGSEVQRPLATVVVGGLVTSTVLTLLILPAIYPFLSRRRTPSLPCDTPHSP